MTVAGELERATAHHLLDVLEALTPSGHHTWTVDAAGITFCDVEGIRVLAPAQSLARSRGRALVLVGPRPFLVYSLVLVGMQSLVDPPSAGSVHGRVGPARRRETTQR
ncbi:STAS domain-containing protein [Geodermatophilus sp. SYSU D00710]